MSIWQYLAVVEGYQQASNPDAGSDLSSEEADALWDWLQTKD